MDHARVQLVKANEGMKKKRDGMKSRRETSDCVERQSPAPVDE